MSGAKLLEQLKLNLPELKGKINCDVSMAQYTWLKVGGDAEILYQPYDENELAHFMQYLPEEVPVTVVGHGSNLLIRDGGIKGVVIRLSGKAFGMFEPIDKEHIKIGVAMPDKQVAMRTQDIGLTGFEFYAGIVGNIGEALRMNAGAHARETRDCVVEVHGINRQGEVVKLSNEEMKYGYRKCGVDENLIFTSCVMRGMPDDKNEIAKRIKEVQTHREESQPIREKTGGSTFQNPPDHSAWKLLDEAGMRGEKIGEAQFSEMHCNFLINLGCATAFEFESLGEMARQKVYEKCNVVLEWEIKRIGEFEKGKSVKKFTVKI